MFLLEITTAEFCNDTATIWGIIGYLVLILKIIVPLLLIVLGMIEFTKAVVSKDEKGTSNAVNSLVRKFIAALLVFLVPTIVSAIFNFFVGLNISKGGFKKCINCMTKIVEVTKNDKDYCKSPD